MRTEASLALVLTMIAGFGLAEAPATSIRPVERPAVQAMSEPEPPAAQQPAAQEPATQAPAVAPKPRPFALLAPAPQTQTTAPSPFPNGVLRPQPRPAGLIQTAANNTTTTPKTPTTKPKPSVKGSVCGDPAIKGQALESIGSRVNGCGVTEPVKVTSVSGVVLNPPATLDCSAARALRSWVDHGLQPAFAPGEVVELRIFGSYMCRSRNNVRGAKISEHGRGRAVDIGGFVLGSGKVLTVASNYNAQIRKAHKAACGIFSTTLGPGSDGYHEDHLHFDTASYRSGTYCR